MKLTLIFSLAMIFPLAHADERAQSCLSKAASLIEALTNQLGIEAAESAKITAMILSSANSNWTMDKLKSKVVDLKKESFSIKQSGSDTVQKFMKEYRDCALPNK